MIVLLCLYCVSVSCCVTERETGTWLKVIGARGAVMVALTALALGVNRASYAELEEPDPDPYEGGAGAAREMAGVD